MSKPGIEQPKKVRTGRCRAYPFCRRECAAYVSHGVVANFETCVCGHTQAVHEEGGGS